MTQHGKYWSYVSTGIKCRCDECREAFRIYQAKRTRQRHAYTKANGLPRDVQHGASAYNNWGCRCDICKAANRVKCAPHQAAWRSRQKVQS